MSRFFATLIAAMMLTNVATAADESGTIRADALVLLAHSARAASVDPSKVRIDDVTIEDDVATVRWEMRGSAGTMTLHRLGSRWVVAVEGVPSATWSGAPLDRRGGTLVPNRSQTGGYELAIRYSASDASPNARFSFAYGRLPTQAEFLPYPTEYPFTTESVFYFDLTVADSKPIAFEPGTVISVWFPFVLDDRIRYDLFLDGANHPIGPITTTVFDNTLSFELPLFTASPGKTLVGEVDGNPH